MKKLLLIMACILVALIGASCILTASNLNNSSMNDQATHSINEQQNTIQDTVINETSEVSKNVQNHTTHKTENKNATEKNAKQNHDKQLSNQNKMNKTSKGSHITTSNKTNTTTNSTKVKSNSTTSKVASNSTVKNKNVTTDKNSSKVKSNNSEIKKQKTINKTTNDTESCSDSQMKKYIAFFKKYQDLDKLIALVSQDHTASETQNIIYQIYGEY